MIPRSGRVVALDWGEVRLGVAASDETQLIAGPLTTLVRRAGQRFPLKRFRGGLETSEAGGGIVGLPLNQGGGGGEGWPPLTLPVPRPAKLDAAGRAGSRRLRC